MMERDVTFDCGHRARRVAKNGRSLIGVEIRCHECHVDRRVVGETAARPLSVLRAS